MDHMTRAKGEHNSQLQIFITQTFFGGPLQFELSRFHCTLNLFALRQHPNPCIKLWSMKFEIVKWSIDTSKVSLYMVIIESCRSRLIPSTNHEATKAPPVQGWPTAVSPSWKFVKQNGFIKLAVNFMEKIDNSVSWMHVKMELLTV